MWLVAVVVFVIAALLGLLGLGWLIGNRASGSMDEPSLARRQFERQRSELEQLFFRLAAASGKPRGLNWAATVWKPEIALARESESGLLTAFVGVDISFTAVEGGEMETVEAVSEIRDATAVFHFRNGTWGTGGRVLFNVSPDEAVTRLQGQFSPISIKND